MVDINAKVGGVTPNLQPTNPAYNTYVGSRYVPVFAATPDSQWDKTLTYEPLTIVINNGNSYTSKTFVPAGIDIDNPEYWALTGNYNAQVELYRQEVTSVSNKLSSIKIKNIILIGDSYGTDTEFITGWITQFSFLNSHLTIYSSALGGASFAGTVKFSDLLQNLITPDNIDIDAVVIVGGANDKGFTENEIRQGFSQCRNIISNKWPNAIIHVMYATRNWNITNINRKNLPVVKNTYMSLGSSCCSDVSSVLLMSPDNLSNDGVHPTTLGNYWLARAIYSKLFGNDFLTPRVMTFNGIVSGNISKISFNYTLLESTQIWDLAGSLQIIGNNISIPSREWVKLCDCNELFNGYSDTNIYNLLTGFSGIIITDSFESIKCSFCFSNRALYIKSWEASPKTFNSISCFLGTNQAVENIYI